MLDGGHLTPDPERANELRAIRESARDRGVGVGVKAGCAGEAADGANMFPSLRDIWPHLHFILAVG